VWGEVAPLHITALAKKKKGTRKGEKKKVFLENGDRAGGKRNERRRYCKKGRGEKKNRKKKGPKSCWSKGNACGRLGRRRKKSKGKKKKKAVGFQEKNPEKKGEFKGKPLDGGRKITGGAEDLYDLERLTIQLQKENIDWLGKKKEKRPPRSKSKGGAT